MANSNFSIKKPGAGAAIYKGIHDAQSAAKNSESKAGLGATGIISSVAVAGFVRR